MKKKPKHARHSPSALGTKEICPAFVNRGGTSPAAEEGTMLHEAVENDDFTDLTDEQAFLCGLCRDYRDGELTRFPNAECFNELKLEIDGGLTYGTADFVAIAGDKGLMMDWKFGRNPVEPAETNAQGCAYALGVLEMYPQLDSIEVHFVQPRTETVSMHTFTRQDVPMMQTRIRTIIRRANARNKQECAGAHCQYCRKQATCTALRNLALPIASRYEGLSIPEQLTASEISDPRMMARCLDCAKVLEEWCKAIKYYAAEMALNGVDIPDYVLTSRAGKKSIGDALGAYGCVQDKMSLETFLSCCGSVGIDELAKAYSEDAPRGRKTQTRDELIQRLMSDGIISQAAPSKFLKRSSK